MVDVVAPVAGRVVVVSVDVGAAVARGETVAMLEVMKMEHPVVAAAAGTVSDVTVTVGDLVEPGAHIASIDPGAVDPTPREADAESADQLAEVRDRHAAGLDERRPEAVAARHDRGRRTARENVADLCDDFVEYGPLAVAAQRGRRSHTELVERTPADGMVGGVGRVDTGTEGDDRAVVVSYDYTVLAGTQGFQNHRKKDRLFELAAEASLPVVLFAEGGGGRPGDVDAPGVSWLDTRAFRLFAAVPGPTIGINTGYCFAGNAALLGSCDVIVATTDSNVGMGGPAMIEGGGLGAFPPEAVGPADVQLGNGVIDVPVDDDASAVAAARSLLGFARGTTPPGDEPDQAALRHVVPANRRRIYAMRDVIAGLVDDRTFLELRPGFAPASVTGFARVGGHPLGIVANDPSRLAGAIDHDAATSIGRHLALCQRWGIPILFLCDTPGFMVGPEAEAEGLVRSAGSLFRLGADLTVPVGTIVTRRGYGLGAQAMSAGGFHEGRFIVGWPTSEFGPMGLEGAVRLGFKRELEAIDDPADREAAFERMVEEMYAVGRGINVASHFEVDDVIDPAESRRWITALLR